MGAGIDSDNAEYEIYIFSVVTGWTHWLNGMGGGVEAE